MHLTPVTGPNVLGHRLGNFLPPRRFLQADASLKSPAFFFWSPGIHALARALRAGAILARESPEKECWGFEGAGNAGAVLRGGRKFPRP
ncbi:MAG: hypothetical protein AAB425_16050 [Bdellovibrionota bacterium]